MNQTQRNFLIYLLMIVFLGIFLYNGALAVTTYHWDDKSAVQNNPAVQHPSSFQQILETFNTRFLPGLSFRLNVKLLGRNIFGFRLVNWLIHILASVAVYSLASVTLCALKLKGHSLTKHADLLPILAGLLFLAHPIQTETVNLITQRFTSLGAFFYITAVSLYGGARIKNSKPLYGLSLIVTVGAMFSKEFCFTIPLAMILYEFLFINGPEYRRANRWALMIPFLCTLPIIPLLLLKPVAAMTPTARIAKTASTHEEQAPSFLSRLDRISRTETEISRKDYFLTQINVLRTYVRLLFWPSKQNIDYDYPITKKFLGIPTVLSAVLLASLLIFAFAIRKRWPLITFGILWFFLTLSVESTVIPIGYVINEHRLYLPMAGWAVAISSILTGLFKSRNALWAVFLLILLSLSFATLRRNTVWKDEITLWEDTSSKSPQKARPVTNLGIAYKDAQQYDKAIMTLLRAIDLDPNNAVAYTAMAFCHRYRGDPPEKEEELLKKAIALNPYYSLAHFGLGYYYHSKGFPDKAIPHYENALLLDPQSESIYKNLAVAYAQNNKLQKINVLIRMLDDQGMEFMAARLRSFFEPKTKKPY